MSQQNQSTKNQFQALHYQLQDLLAGYVDNMLDEQEQMLVEAHLAGCEDCRMDVARQEAMHQRLNKLSVTRMPTHLHDKIDQLLLEQPTSIDPLKSEHKAHHVSQNLDWLQSIKALVFSTASGWSVALILMIMLLIPSFYSLQHTEIPMVQEVLAEYHQLNVTSLPTSDQSISQQPPAQWQGSHVLARWKTDIGGAPAEAFAVRHGDTIIFQFRVDETVFFRNPDVRAAVAKSGNYRSNHSNLEVLALPLNKAGLLIVGPDNGIPKPDTLTLTTI